MIIYPNDRITEKATSLNEKLHEVENYTYLASPELKKLIPPFRNAVYSYDKSANQGTKEAPDKMDDLLEKIEMTINKDIKKSLERIEKLTH